MIDPSRWSTDGSLISQPGSRRAVLKTASCGFGYLALAGLASAKASEVQRFQNPLTSRQPHFTARAKRVIFMFMQGGPSQYETFDYQPELIAAAERPGSGDSNTRNKNKGELLPPRYSFQPHGESGMMISELFPHLARHADDLCLLNGMHTDSPAHPQASMMLHTGSVNFVRPSLGSWVVYGLGTENENLPGFVTINPGNNAGGAQNYGSAFLPASFQGTRAGVGRDSVANINNPTLSTHAQRKQLELVQSMNRDYLEQAQVNNEIEGVIQSFELAFRMQSAVPGVLDLTKETPATKKRYGIGGGPASNFGVQCLMARRLAEAGVRFIEISRNGWDQHNNLTKNIGRNALSVDQPIAALIADLKQRGLFEDTLLVWGGEFGRTPQGQNADGRRHNNRGYSMWLAGGGVRGGLRYGASDPISGAAVDDKVHLHDLHATILHLLGLNHEALTYRYAGRDFRLTDVYGNVVHDVLG